MIHITGDKHGDYSDIENFCVKFDTTKKDIMIVLGDNGVNYYGEKKDRRLKRRLQELPITFIMIKGNHDMRPETIDGYKMHDFDEHDYAGNFYVQDEYPSLLFTKEYGAYEFGGKFTYIIGGAYSVDKYYRLEQYDLGNHQYRWFWDEQLSDEQMNKAFKMMGRVGEADYIMSHTCPLKYEPTDMFLKGLDQSSVDNTMEKWLDKVEENIKYNKWFCGHWHTDRTIDKMRFMYHDIIALE